MNSNGINNYRLKNKIRYTSCFSKPHPPGGLIAWPDGSTSIIGERRISGILMKDNNAEQKAFVAMPEKTHPLMRA